MQHSRYVESKRAIVASMWELIVPDHTQILDRALARVHAVHVLHADGLFGGGLFGLASFTALLESAVRRLIRTNRIPQPDLWNHYPWMEEALDGIAVNHDHSNALAAAQAFLTQPRFLAPPLTYPVTAQTRFSRLHNRYYEST